MKKLDYEIDEKKIVFWVKKVKAPISIILFIIAIFYGIQTFNKYVEIKEKKYYTKLIAEFNGGKKLFDGENIISKEDGWIYNNSEKIFQKNDKYSRINNLRLVP